MNDPIEPVDPLDPRLRQLAHELHQAAPPAPDWEDIAAPPLATTALQAGRAGGSRWVALTAAAALVVAVVAGIAVIRAVDDQPPAPLATDPATTLDGGATTVGTTVVDGTATTTPAETTSPSTSGPSTSGPPTTAADAGLPPISVSHDDPPPPLELTPVATVEVASDPEQGSAADAIVVALEGGRVAVLDDAAGELIVVDPATGERRVPLDRTTVPDLTGMAVGGPRGVIYAVLEPGSRPTPSATEVVAIPTDGPRAGQAVMNAPIDLTTYTDVHGTVLGLGPITVLDKRTGDALIRYVDPLGEPFQAPMSAPVYPLVDRSDGWSEYDAGIDVAPTGGAAPRWRVEVDREPSSTAPPADGPEPTAVGGARVLVSTAIGPNVPADGGQPTTTVVAILQPDGSGAWWSVPDGWTLAAADLYGVLYTRTAGTTIEIARPTVLPVLSPATVSPIDLPPDGDLAIGPDDLLLVHEDGDLHLHAGLLGGDPSSPVRLLDLGDPREQVTEGPGPDVVDGVAGVTDGVLYAGTCCEPVAGTLLGITGADGERVVVGFGSAPALSPDRRQIATVNPFAVSVLDLDAATNTSAEIVQTDDFLNTVGVAWSADGRQLVVLAWDSEGHRLLPYDAVTLAPGEPVELDVAVDAAGPTAVSLAGRGSGGELAIAVEAGDATELRFLDPVTFEELPAMRQRLPAGATSVRVGPDGTRLLWVVDGRLVLRDGATDRELATGVATAWFP